MSNSSQQRALKNYRKRLDASGMARFEVLGLNTDRELIRAVARQLATGGADSVRLRKTVKQTLAGEPAKKGGILAALRRSPLVGESLDVVRPIVRGRKVDL